MYRIVLFMIILAMVMRSAGLAGEPAAYVLNGTGETLSKINLNTGIVNNDIVTIGTDVSSYPNQIIIRDTLAFVIASGTNEIQVINLNTEQTANFINTGTYSNPYWMDFLDEQYLYITLLLRNSVAKVDYRTASIVGEVTVGQSPEGIVITGDKAYIACTGFDWGTFEYDSGKVAVYDITGDSVIDQIDVGLNPQFLALDSLGRVHVVCTGDYYSVFGRVYIVDTASDTVIDSIYLGGSPGHISVGPDNIAYLAAAGFTLDGHVYSYNVITGEVYHDVNDPINVDLNCMTVAAYQDSTCFTGSFTDYVNVIDSGGNYLNSYAVGDGPVHVAFNYLPGDVNGDFSVNLLDVTHLINWLYKGDSGPRWPKWRANANADRAYNLLDVTYIIRYLYKEGPRPRIASAWM